MLDAIRAEDTSPTLASRSLAIFHSALYDSVNSVCDGYQSYKFQLPAAADTSVEAAAVGAANLVLQNLYPGFAGRARSLYESWITNAVQDSSLTNGLMLGEAIAQMAIQDRASDGSSTEVPYNPSDAAGQWRRTPPLFRPPLDPHWRYVEPFCLPSTERFVPPPPPALDSPAYAAALKEVAGLGAKASSSRTSEQSQTAKFWSDFSYTCTPPGHMMLIAKDICQRRGMTLVESSRLFALISLAVADSAIVCWEAKYRYNFWRPITAIWRADEDDNPATTANPSWDEFLVAPNFPSYTSGHSTFSKAATRVMTYVLGTDAVTFTVGSDSLPTEFRTYQSLAACAEEIGMSRIYAGIHFSFDKEEGAISGAKIADFVSLNYLLPNERLPFARLEGFQNEIPVIRVHAHIARNFVLEASSDLAAWQGVQTNKATAGGVVVLDATSTSTQAQRFYRVREQ